MPSLVGEYLHGSHTAEWVHTEEMLGTARFKVFAPVQVSRFRLGHVVDPPMEFSVFPSQFLHKRAKFFEHDPSKSGCKGELFRLKRGLAVFGLAFVWLDLAPLNLSLPARTRAGLWSKFAV